MPPRNEAIPQPLWRTPAARIILGVVLVAILFIGIRRLERINLRHQTERRLAADSVLGPKVEKLRQIVAANLKLDLPLEQRANQQLAVALYFGHVARFESGKELHGMPATTVLYLGSPILLAGQAGKNDSAESVAVSWKNQVRGLDLPAAGEDWIIAVWRDTSGNNVVHTAERCEW